MCSLLPMPVTCTRPPRDSQSRIKSAARSIDSASVRVRRADNSSMIRSKNLSTACVGSSPLRVFTNPFFKIHRSCNSHYCLGKFIERGWFHSHNFVWLLISAHYHQGFPLSGQIEYWPLIGGVKPCGKEAKGRRAKSKRAKGRMLFALCSLPASLTESHARCLRGA